MLALLVGAESFAAKSYSYTLTSPNGKLAVVVDTEGKLSYAVKRDGKEVVAPSAIALKIYEGATLGEGCRVKRAMRTTINERIVPYFYFRSEIKDNYNALRLDFAEKFSVEFRAYDDAVAYRFLTSFKEDFIVENEVAEFAFPADSKAFIPYNNLTGNRKDKYFTSFEQHYTYDNLSAMSKDKLAFTPVAVESAGYKVCIAESNVEHYPGMFVANPTGAACLQGVFAPLPNEVVVGGHNKLQGIVASRKPYIAECKGKSQLPWRIIAVAERDSELLDSDVVYRLASPSRLADVSWIKPGKVAWEWWNHWGIKGVPFEAGVNTDTYKYYVDFAAKNGIEYVILDEGWAVKYANDLMQIVPEIDLKEIIGHASKKGVGIILWAGFNAIANDPETVCRHYAEMGVKGFKVDFLDRDDQQMMDFMFELAKIAAEHKLMIDYHGCPKPMGLNRTYPNVINFEGVLGLENVKFSKTLRNKVDLAEYDVTMPYLRMLAGPIDYTQGAMRNASKRNFRVVNEEPMSMGTRSRQLAMYAIFYSPFSMLCDSPSLYEREQESVDFISAAPTVWDKTVALDGKMGEYIAMARRSGEEWYVGVITSWEPRDLELDLSFLGEGDFKAEIFRDGANSHRIASDYVHETIDIPSSRKIKVQLAPAGGYAMRIYKR